jgi:protein TonB
MRNLNAARLLVFGAVAALHAFVLVFFVVHMGVSDIAPNAPLTVMKLTDIREAAPPPPPPERKPERRQSPEPIAQNMVETETPPPEPEFETAPAYRPPEAENYLPMHRVSFPPVIAETDLLKSLAYPPIAQRSGVEGMVHLELFIDRQGIVQRVVILKETPENYGFGEAAAKAFRGRACTPAQANGEPVAVRYRYPVRFKLTG